MKKKDFEKKYRNELDLDLPIEYKGLSIYPVSVKDFNKFMDAISVLMFEKESIKDENILKMSYLEFLINLMYDEIYREKSKPQDTRIIRNLNTLFGNISFSTEARKHKDMVFTSYFIHIRGLKFTSSDFNNIKDIVLFQNLSNYDNKYINPRMKEMIAKKNSNNDNKVLNLEERKMAMCLNTSYKIEELNNLALRKFSIMLNMCDKRESYNFCRIAQMLAQANGAKVNSDITHWLHGKEKSVVDGIIAPLDTLKDKLKHVT